MSSISVTAAFCQQVAAVPQQTAVSAGSEQLSYAQLDRWSDVLAGALVSEHGVRRGDRVAIRMERSVALVVALLGILKAGAAYVPIDAAEPGPRVVEKLQDAEPRVVVCDGAGVAELAGCGVPVTQVPSPSAAGPLPSGAAGPQADDLAYLMYTSGSTGKPKAVMVEHRNITNLVLQPNFVDLRADDKLLQLAPIAFDAATFEIWGALLNGLQLVLAPPGPVEADELGELLHSNGITVLWLTAALFHHQIDVDVDAFTGLRTVLAGGDVLSAAHLRRLQRAVPDCRVVNGYGPTETTTFASCHRVVVADLGPTVPIGRPVQHVSVRIVDRAGVPVPAGTPGELWIGGAGVSRGYWRQPELTARSFVTVAEEGGECARFYRTGDQAVRTPAGVLEFLGRRDGQFKLRGYRIEPGEVESALAEEPQVGTAAVGVRENHLGERALVAWLAVRGGELDRRALRASLRSRLPSYLIPTAFVALTSLPVTPNGKIDRQALPDPDWTSRSSYV